MQDFGFDNPAVFDIDTTSDSIGQWSAVWTPIRTDVGTFGIGENTLTFQKKHFFNFDFR
jgi:hypothetical protein